jgi:thioesterase domain-containing protein
VGPDALLERILELGQRSGALGPEVGLAELRALRRVFESNLQAAGRYAPKPYGGAITLIRARKPVSPGVPEDRGWGALATGGLKQHEVEGDHYTLLRPPAVERLAERLNACLEQALEPPLPFKG